jgi:hypothetical protein
MPGALTYLPQFHNSYTAMSDYTTATVRPYAVTHLPLAFAYLTLKMEAVCLVETSVDFQRTKQLYIPADSTLNFITCFEIVMTSFNGLETAFPLSRDARALVSSE